MQIFYFQTNRRRKMDIAMEKHNRLMTEAMNGEGCDRHLLGLKILAQERGLPTPEIFTDSAWKKRYFFIVGS